jgi:hypothetical protein
VSVTHTHTYIYICIYMYVYIYTYIQCRFNSDAAVRVALVSVTAGGQVHIYTYTVCLKHANERKETCYVMRVYNDCIMCVYAMAKSNGFWWWKEWLLMVKKGFLFVRRMASYSIMKRMAPDCQERLLDCKKKGFLFDHEKNGSWLSRKASCL